MWLHELGELENECTSHNSSLFDVFLPNIIKIGVHLTKFWQKQICTVFFRRGVVSIVYMAIEQRQSRTQWWWTRSWRPKNGNVATRERETNVLVYVDSLNDTRPNCPAGDLVRCFTIDNNYFMLLHNVENICWSFTGFSFDNGKWNVSYSMAGCPVVPPVNKFVLLDMYLFDGGITVKLASNIWSFQWEKLKVSRSGVKVMVKVIGNPFIAFPVSVTVCIQMCECYMAEAYVSTVWCQVALICQIINIIRLILDIYIRVWPRDLTYCYAGTAHCWFIVYVQYSTATWCKVSKQISCAELVCTKKTWVKY